MYAPKAKRQLSRQYTKTARIIPRRFYFRCLAEHEEDFLRCERLDWKIKWTCAHTLDCVHLKIHIIHIHREYWDNWRWSGARLARAWNKYKPNSWRTCAQAVFFFICVKGKPFFSIAPGPKTQKENKRREDVSQRLSYFVCSFVSEFNSRVACFGRSTLTQWIKSHWNWNFVAICAL